ncbi:hypothetical protein SLE2022_311190 [Rubroshorea leprosula]
MKLLLLDTSFSELLIESDSAITVRLLSSPCSPSHRLSTFLLDCRELLQQFDLVEFAHIVRECHMCTDQSARIGSSLGHPFLLFWRSDPLLFLPFVLLMPMGLFSLGSP